MNRTFKKTLYISLTVLFTPFSLAIYYALAAIVCSLIPVNGRNSEATKGDISIYILSNGVHTDLVLPIKNEYKDWGEELKVERTLSKDTAVRYIAFGWGDKGFYLDTPSWAELKFGTAFRAAFSLSTSAMHTTFYRYMYEGDNCIRLDVNEETYRKLVTLIDNRFDKDKDGHYIYIAGHSYDYNDSFYEAKGSYNLFFTCNTWVNSTLKHVGLRACLWTPADKGIFYQYR